MHNRLLLVLCLALPTTSLANDSAFGGSGALPMPIKEDRIAMVAEKITIKGYHISKPNMGGRWLYDCQFKFVNTSDEKIQLLMGFPFPIDEGMGDIATPAGITVKKGDPLIYDFTVILAGKGLTSKRSSIASDEKRDLYYTQAYLWPMTFGSRQTINLSHGYSSGVTQDVMGYDWVSYVLKTGRLWQGGKIGQTVIEVTPGTPTRLCSEIDKQDYLKPQPLGLQIAGHGSQRRYLWKLNDFMPDKDVNLCLMTSNKYVLHKLIYPILSNGGKPPAYMQKLSRKKLRLLRNTIYARHGRMFKNAHLAHYFQSQWWYQANPNYSDVLLTDDDKKALRIIKAAEIYPTQ